MKVNNLQRDLKDFKSLCSKDSSMTIQKPETFMICCKALNQFIKYLKSINLSDDQKMEFKKILIEEEALVLNKVFINPSIRNIINFFKD